MNALRTSVEAEALFSTWDKALRTSAKRII